MIILGILVIGSTTLLLVHAMFESLKHDYWGWSIVMGLVILHNMYQLAKLI